MKIIDSRLRKLEDRFGTGDGKPRILFVVCRAGYQHDLERHIDILDESGLLPTEPVGLVCLAGVPRGLDAAGGSNSTTAKAPHPGFTTARGTGVREDFSGSKILIILKAANSEERV